MQSKASLKIDCAFCICMCVCVCFSTCLFWFEKSKFKSILADWLRCPGLLDLLPRPSSFIFERKSTTGERTLNLPGAIQQQGTLNFHTKRPNISAAAKPFCKQQYMQTPGTLLAKRTWRRPVCAALLAVVPLRGLRSSLGMIQIDSGIVGVENSIKHFDYLQIIRNVLLYPSEGKHLVKIVHRIGWHSRRHSGTTWKPETRPENKVWLKIIPRCVIWWWWR